MPLFKYISACVRMSWDSSIHNTMVGGTAVPVDHGRDYSVQCQEVVDRLKAYMATAYVPKPAHGEYRHASLTIDVQDEDMNSLFSYDCDTADRIPCDTLLAEIDKVAPTVIKETANALAYDATN